MARKSTCSCCFDLVFNHAIHNFLISLSLSQETRGWKDLLSFWQPASSSTKEAPIGQTSLYAECEESSVWSWWIPTPSYCSREWLQALDWEFPSSFPWPCRSSCWCGMAFIWVSWPWLSTCFHSSICFSTGIRSARCLSFWKHLRGQSYSKQRCFQLCTTQT